MENQKFPLVSADHTEIGKVSCPTANALQNEGWSARVAAAARQEDLGKAHISHSFAELQRAGFLADKIIPTDALLRRLVTVAEANLPLGRLFEGHVNALALVERFGDDRAKREAASACARGLLFGVWGAEGATPLRLEHGALVGGKRFASGLGTVGLAVVTLGQGDRVRLALLDVTDPSRHSHNTWTKIGMRATASGDFEATGLPAASLTWIGRPGQYLEEPGFIGGVWRIAALQLGGTLGLLRAAANDLSRLDRLGSEQQVARLSPVLTRALAAGGFVERAAHVAEGPEGQSDPEGAACLSAQARLLTEDIGQDAIAAVERSVGLQHFDEASDTGRMARDLATYMRQAGRDALLQRAGRWALGQVGPYSALLGKRVGNE